MQPANSIVRIIPPIKLNLNDIEKRIKTIQLIENERKSLDISEQKLKSNYSTIYSQIKEVLLQIVQIDAKLMDIVSAKKDSILSELKEIDKIKKMSSKPKTNEAKIIDIRQSQYVKN